VENPTVAAAPAEPVAAPAVTDVRSRSETIYGFAASAGLTAREADALVSSGRDIDSIGKELLERMNKQADHAAAPQPAVELTAREQKQYSLMNALNAIASGTRSGFEFDVSDEFAKKTGRSYTNGNSFFLPLNVRTQLSIGASNKGGELRATELRPELIELLRQRSLAIQLGARFMPGLVGNVAFPRQTAAATAEWVAEAPGSDMSLSSLSLDQVTLSPKTLQASTTVSRQLLAQSTPAADQIVFDDLIAQHAVAIDKAVFWGTGASNQPTGVGVASGTNVVAMGTNGAAISLTKVLEGLKEIEIDNAMTDNVVFVTTPGVKYKAAETAKVASTDSVMLWDILTGTVMGVPAYATNNIPSTLTKGSTSGAAHGGIIGDFSQVMVGEWGAGAEIIVDPYSLARRNLIQITSIQFADVQVRVPSAFAVYRDFTI
jgi:HK97 family phage major capsid protein